MIIHILNTSSYFWIPINIAYGLTFQPAIFAAVNISELLLYLLSGYILYQSCKTFMSIRLFHSNMILLMAFCLYQWFEAIVARLVILTYQCGWFSMGELETKLVPFWTDSDSQMIVVQSYNGIVFVSLAGAAIWHYIISMIAGCIAVGIERLLSTFYIQDYESKPRSYIPFLLIILVHCVSIPISSAMTFYLISFQTTTILSLTVMIIVLMIYTTVWAWNNSLKRKIDKSFNNVQYSLGQQFQVKENIRCLIMARRVVLSTSSFIFLSLFLMIALVLNVFPEEYEKFFIRLLENCIFIYTPIGPHIDNQSLNDWCIYLHFPSKLVVAIFVPPKAESSFLTFMIFLVNGTYTIWVHVLILNKLHYTKPQWPYSVATFFITFPFIIVFILRTCYIIWKYRAFHTNLSLILIFQHFQYFEGVLAYAFQIKYIAGWNLVGDPSKMYLQFWTSDISEMVPVNSIWDEWPLFLGGFLLVHNYSNNLVFIFSVSLERAIASFYLSNYERKSRLYVFVAVFTISVIFSTTVSLIFSLNILTFTVYYTITLFILMLSVIFYFFVWYYNTKIKKFVGSDGKCDDSYSLATRFQTLENIKSLQMAKRVVTAYAILVVVTNGSLMMAHYRVSTNIWHTVVYTLHFFIYLSPFVMCPLTIRSVDVWKEAASKYSPCLKRAKTPKIGDSYQKTGKEATEIETETYFMALNKSWS